MLRPLQIRLREGVCWAHYIDIAAFSVTGREAASTSVLQASPGHLPERWPGTRRSDQIAAGGDTETDNRRKTRLHKGSHVFQIRSRLNCRGRWADYGKISGMWEEWIPSLVHLMDWHCWSIISIGAQSKDRDERAFHTAAPLEFTDQGDIKTTQPF